MTLESINVRAEVTAFLDMMANPRRSGAEVYDRMMRLGDIGYQRVLPIMAAALDDEDFCRSVTAAWFVLLTGADARHTATATKQFERALQARAREQRRFAVNMLLSSGTAPTELVPPLRQLLSSKDAPLRVAAAAVLSQAGAAGAVAIPVLTQSLHLDDDELSVMSATALVRVHVREDEALRTLMQRLARPKLAIQFMVLAALADMGAAAQSAIPALINVLKDKRQPTPLRANVANVLGKIGTGSAAVDKALVAVLRDKEWEIVWQAVHSLKAGRSAGKAAMILVELLEADDAGRRKIAARALAQLGGAAETSIPALMRRLDVETDDEIILLVVEALVATGNAAVPPLIERLKRLDMRNMAAVTAALGAIGTVSVPEVTRMLLTADDANARHAAAAMLRAIGPQARAAVPTLIDLLHQRDVSLRKASLAAITNIGQEAVEAVPAVVECLGDDDGDVAAWVEAALVSIGTEALQALEDARPVAAGRQRERIDATLKRIRGAAGTGDYVADAAIDVFMLVGRIIEKHGPMSFRRLAKHIADMKELGKVSDDLPFTGAGYIQKKIRQLEERLSKQEGRPVRLIARERDARRPGGLTADGKRLLKQAGSLSK